MKNIAIIKNMKGEIMETRKFRSYPEVERFVAKKYGNRIFDWDISKDLIKVKPGEMELMVGLDYSLEEAKVHRIMIKGE